MSAFPVAKMEVRVSPLPSVHATGTDDERVDFDVLMREKRELMETLNKMLERANNVDMNTSTDVIKVST
jgi:hypothetical protein